MLVTDLVDFDMSCISKTILMSPLLSVKGAIVGMLLPENRRSLDNG